MVRIMTCIQYLDYFVKDVLPIVALIFTALQIMFLARQLKLDRKLEQERATYQYMERYYAMIEQLDPIIVEKLGLVTFINHNLTKDDFKNLLMNTEYRIQISKVIQFYETFCTGILNQYYDEEIAKQLCAANLISFYDVCRSYIDYRREEIHIPVCGELEKIAKRWKSSGILEKRVDEI